MQVNKKHKEYLGIKRKDELHTLIRSLSKGEKKLFRQLAGITVDEKNYVRLFSAMEKMREYNETLLKGRFKNLPTEKQYLQKQILYVLRLLHAEDNAGLQLDTQIAEAEALMDKRLFSACERIIVKAERMASENELFAHLLTLHRLKVKLAVRSGNYEVLYHLREKEIPELYKTTKKYLVQEELIALSGKIFAIISTDGDISSSGVKELEKLIRDPLLKAPAKEMSFLASVYYYQCHNYYHYRKNNIRKAYEVNKKAVNLFEEHPDKIIQNTQSYYTWLKNLYNRAYTLGRYKECYGIANKVEELLVSYKKNISGSLKLEIQFAIYEMRVELLCTDKKYEDAVTLSLGTEKLVADNVSKLRLQNILFFRLFSSIGLFETGRFRDALRYVNEILNDKNISVRHDMVLFAHVLNAMVHYELKNFELIERACKHINAYNKKHELGFRSAKLVADLFHRLLKANGNKSKAKAAYAAALRDMQPLLKHYDEKRLLSITGLLDLINKRGK